MKIYYEKTIIVIAREFLRSSDLTLDTHHHHLKDDYYLIIIFILIIKLK